MTVSFMIYRKNYSALLLLPQLGNTFRRKHSPCRKMFARSSTDFPVWAYRLRCPATHRMAALCGCSLARFDTQDLSVDRTLFGMLLPTDYPPRKSSYFWKAMTPIILLHSVVLLVVVGLTLYFAYIHAKLPVRMALAVITATVVAEYYLSLRIIRAVTP